MKTTNVRSSASPVASATATGNERRGSISRRVGMMSWLTGECSKSSLIFRLERLPIFWWRNVCGRIVGHRKNA